MASDIRIELFRTFCTVAEEGSFSAAARRLYVSQPAVSQSIAQLERALGMTLIIRAARGITLTTEGQTLLNYMGQAFRLMHTGQEKVEELRSLKAGRVSIAASDTICRFVLLPYLASFHEMYPDVSLYITNCSSGAALEKLRDGSVELAFVNMPLDADGITTEPIYQVHDCFVLGDKYRHLLSRPVTPYELAQYPLLMVEKQSNSRRFVEACFLAEGITLKPHVELESHELVGEFAAIGLGIGCVMKEFVQKELQQNKLSILPLTKELPARSIGMSYLSTIPLTVAGKAFCQHIRGEEITLPNIHKINWDLPMVYK